MKKFITNMFSVKDGVSHKRVLGALGFMCLIIYMFIYNDPVAIEAVEYVTIAYGIGTVAEKFAKPSSKEEQPIEQEQQ
jgi:hypothetical protein